MKNIDPRHITTSSFAPVVTEKADHGVRATNKCCVQRVASKATKPQIKEAVEKIVRTSR